MASGVAILGEVPGSVQGGSIAHELTLDEVTTAA